MFKLIRLNVLFYMLLFLEVDSEDKPLAHRAVSFEDFKNGKVLTGFSLESYSKTSQSDCAKSCLATNACLSFNHCESQECELNSGDAHSENAYFADSSSCYYFGMEIKEAVLCEEMGVSHNVSSLSDKDKCNIGEKKHEVSWGSWDRDVEIDEDYFTNEYRVTQYKGRDARECLGFPAHGNTCHGKHARVEWFKLIWERMKWEEGRTACENEGGKLFSNMDENTSQSYFIDDRVYEAWTGIRKGVNASWFSLDGRIIPDNFFKWGSGQPKELLFERAIEIHGGYSFDDSQSSFNYPLCDML